MARKKKTGGPKAPRQGNFKNDPFSHLKGFVVSGEEKRPAPKKPERPAPVAEPEGDFLAAMAGLGVERLDEGDSQDLEPNLPPKPSVEAAADEDDGEKLFLEALGQLDVRFEDGVVEEDGVPAASPRRIRQLVRGKLRVDARLDLHGFSRDEALEKFDRFLVNARHQGACVLLVITGKGHHSTDGPVVREAIERRLRLQRPDGLLEWQRAPRQFGGEGALVLFFRAPSEG